MRIPGNEAQIKVVPHERMSKGNIQIIWNLHELSSALNHSSASCKMEIFKDFLQHLSIYRHSTEILTMFK